MKAIIHKVPEGITFEDFKKKYAKYFPISNKEKRDSEMAKEYQRLTGAVAVAPVKRGQRALKKENESTASD